MSHFSRFFAEFLISSRYLSLNFNKKALQLVSAWVLTAWFYLKTSSIYCFLNYWNYRTLSKYLESKGWTFDIISSFYSTFFNNSSSFFFSYSFTYFSSYFYSTVFSTTSYWNGASTYYSFFTSSGYSSYYFTYSSYF